MRERCNDHKGEGYTSSAVPPNRGGSTRDGHQGGCAPGGLGVTGCYITAGRTPRLADLLTLWVESVVLIPRFGGTGSAEKVEVDTFTPRPGCGRRGIKTIINLYTTEFDLHYLHIFTITLVTAVVSIKR